MTCVAHTVPVLVTWDVDPDAWLPVEKRLWALETACHLCATHDIPATFFFTAKLAETYTDRFPELWSQGHEIGCHGLTHGIEENYDRMPEQQQRDYIAQATTKLRHLAGDGVHSFRSPRVKISATTLRLLAEYGYRADSSICPQRADFISSNLLNIGWLFAPRRPYHPRPDHAFRRGDRHHGKLPIWEVPISAAGVPFISSAFRVLGLRPMQALFHVLYAEARRTGKPIVYLAHPTEFLGGERTSNLWAWRQFLNPKYLKPSYIRAHGLRLRNLLYTIKGSALIDATAHLFAIMAAAPGVRFLTVRDYTQEFLDAR